MYETIILFSLQTSHTERIDALELLGATFVDKKRDLLGALKYWKRAMDLRYTDSNNIVHKPEPKQLIMAYDYAREVSNSFEPVCPPSTTPEGSRIAFNALEIRFIIADMVIIWLRQHRF